jgi:hypothetical protein
MVALLCAGREDQSFALSSVHLKSEANDWKPRMEQLEFLDSKVAPEHDTLIIVGDFNFLFKREEVLHHSELLAPGDLGQSYLTPGSIDGNHGEWICGCVEGVASKASWHYL